jgi:phage I-like protein
MEPVLAQLQARFDSNPEPENMKTLLAALIPLLALAATATEEDAVKAVEALKTKADDKAKPSLPVPLVTALGLQAGADEAQALSAIAALKGGDKATATLVQNLQGQVVALTTQLQGDKVKALLDDAVERCLMLPAQRAQYEAIGKANFEQLQALVAGMEPLAGLRGQSDGKDHGTGGNNTDAVALAAKARVYQAEQLKAGVTVNTAQAVAAVAAAK